MIIDVKPRSTKNIDLLNILKPGSQNTLVPVVRGSSSRV